jgi:hypothetical protein
MKLQRQRPVLARGRLGPAPAFLSACWALALLGGCGSSDNQTLGSKIGGNKGGGGDGAGVGTGGESSMGGGSNLFGHDGGRPLGDSSTPVIKADAACGESTIVAAPRQVSILLVIDESGSMADTPAGFTADKWSALKSALGAALSPVENDIAFGLELFPYPLDPKNPILVGCTTNCCEMPAAPGINIPIGPGASSVPKIVAALDATAPGGGTPTGLALERALDYFKSGAGSAIAGDRYVLLATDGGPDCNATLSACNASKCTTNLDGECPLPAGGNCCDAAFGGSAATSRCLDDGTGAGSPLTALNQLKSAGVKTFVVGIPGTEVYKSSLDAFAQAGGEQNPSAPPQYFAVSASGGAKGLVDVLRSITQSLVTTCRLELTSDPPVHNLLNVHLDGRIIPEGPNGWTLDTTTSPPTVVLQGSTCTTVETEGAQRVQVLFGCPTTVR